MFFILFIEDHADRGHQQEILFSRVINFTKLIIMVVYRTAENKILVMYMFLYNAAQPAASEILTDFWVANPNPI